MIALLVAAGVASVIPRASHPLAFGAALAFALGVLAHLTVAVTEQSLGVVALTWVSLPGDAVELRWDLSTFNLVWAIISLLAVGVPLLRAEQASPILGESPWAWAALAIVGPLLLSGDLSATAVLLALLLIASAMAALEAAQTPVRFDENATDALRAIAAEGMPPLDAGPSTISNRMRARVTTVRRLLLDLVSVLALSSFAMADATAGVGTPDVSARVIGIAGALLLARVYPIHTLTYGTAASQTWRALLSFTGIFVLHRVMVPGSVEERGLLEDVLLAIGALTVVASALDAHRAADDREWAARTIPGDVGLAVIAIAVGLPMSLAVLVILAFGRMIGGAVLALADLQRSQPNRSRRSRRDDTVAAASALACGTLAGFPPFPGYVARAMLIEALLASQMWLAAAIVVAGMALHVSSVLSVACRAAAERSTEAVAPASSGTRAENAPTITGPALLFVTGLLVAFALVPSVAPTLVSWLSVSQPDAGTTSIEAFRLKLPGVLLTGLGLLSGYLIAERRGRDLRRAAAGSWSRLVAPDYTAGTSGPGLRVLGGLAHVSRRLEDDGYLPAAIFLGLVVVLALL